jgi:FkbH-like protein
VPEPIRLIVWDLDETFWRGTLTEGGITYVDRHQEIVVELARRGIVSSICSRNHLAPVRELLEAHGAWRYFVFPSIDWDAKGPRLAAMVEAVQLRPATILFIDDNPMNRNEARHYLPDIQVADETIIPSLLDNPLCAGKVDAGLTRLAQYKLLEARHADRRAVSDSAAFLRASGITVTVEHDLAPHLGRVIELINRTNQLNFTKRRLPEDAAEARAELLRQLGGPMNHAGIVRVKDRYGDYGFVGFYLLHSFARRKTLEHFCFSCRTLGMSVEAWLYEQLGRPGIKIEGEVLTDLAQHPTIDWINRDTALEARRERLAGRILVRGGCPTSNLAHYLELNADEVIGEFNVVRHGAGVRIDHSAFLHHALNPLSPDEQETASMLGYQPEDFASVLADAPESIDICILNFSMDGLMATYRHPQQDARLPFLQSHGNMVLDVLRRREPDGRPIVRQAIEAVRSAGLLYEPPDAARFAAYLAGVMERIPQRAAVFFLLGPEQSTDPQGKLVPLRMHLRFNAVLRAIAAARPHTWVLQPEAFVREPGDRVDPQHFGRMVYFRMYRHILDMLRDTAPAEQPRELAPALA